MSIFYRIAVPILCYVSFAVCVIYLGVNLPALHFSTLLKSTSYAELSVLSIILFLSIKIVHELGHFLGGFFVRMQIIALNFGPFVRVQLNDNIYWKINRSVLSWFRTSVVLPETIPSSAKSKIIYLLSGSISSIAFCFFFLFIAHISHSFSFPSFEIIGYLGTFYSLLYLVFTLLPIHYNQYFQSDGYGLILEWSKHSLFLNVMAARSVKVQSSIGIRPRDWISESITALSFISTHSHDRYSAKAQLYLYYYYIDTGEIEKARNCLQEVLAQQLVMSETDIQSATLELIYLDGFLSKKGISISLDESFLNPATVPFYNQCKALAAYYYSTGELERALHYTHVAIDQMNGKHTLGIYKLHEDQLMEMAFTIDLEYQNQQSQTTL